jgi:substrate import-associated zinc metallohydrolase lipoprotein
MKKLCYIIILFAGIVLSACNEKLDPESIFPNTQEELDPTSYSFQLDSFCKKNFLEEYNVEFRYRMQDISSDMDFNLVPCTYDNAITMAVLAKYLWWDVYDAVTGSPEFLRHYGPRIICLIGSAGHNSTGSVTLGVAQGGLKVTLHAINYIDPSNVSTLNEYYFKTMHHEFSHILH